MKITAKIKYCRKAFILWTSAVRAKQRRNEYPFIMILSLFHKIFVFTSITNKHITYMEAKIKSSWIKPNLQSQPFQNKPVPSCYFNTDCFTCIFLSGNNLYTRWTFFESIQKKIHPIEQLPVSLKKSTCTCKTWN